jgi:hypothetical protein
MQKGDLARIEQADFGMALLLEPGTTGLLAMKPPRLAMRKVHAVFDASAGLAIVTLSGAALVGLTANPSVWRFYAAIACLVFVLRYLMAIAASVPATHQSHRIARMLAIAESKTHVQKLWIWLLVLTSLTLLASFKYRRAPE